MNHKLILLLIEEKKEIVSELFEHQIDFFLNKYLVNQKLFFNLGHQGHTMAASLKSRTNMASISKVTRNSNEAPSHLTINEWFNYASSTISAVGRFLKTTVVRQRIFHRTLNED